MAIIVKPKTWNPSDTPVNTDLNSDFDTLYNDYNGNITDANCAAGMALQAAKVLFTALTATGPGTQAATQLTTWAEAKLQQLIGSGGTAPVYGQTLLTNTTQVAGSTAPGDLITYTLPANTLTTNGRGLRIRAWGTFANTGTARTVAVAFGGTNVITKAGNVSLANMVWEIEVLIWRTGLNAQTYIARATNHGGTTVSSVDGATVQNQMTQGTLAITETAGIIIKGLSTVETVASDIIQKGLLVEAI